MPGAADDVTMADGAGSEGSGSKEARRKMLDRRRAALYRSSWSPEKKAEMKLQNCQRERNRLARMTPAQRKEHRVKNTASKRRSRAKAREKKLIDEAEQRMKTLEPYVLKPGDIIPQGAVGKRLELFERRNWKRCPNCGSRDISGVLTCRRFPPSCWRSDFSDCDPNLYYGTHYYADNSDG